LPKANELSLNSRDDPKQVASRPLLTNVTGDLRIALRFSISAVKTEIWIAVSVYVLVAIIRKRLGLEMSLYQILQIFSITLLEKMPISCVLEAFDSRSELLDNSSQLILFEF
jgi:hypothetical protein